MARYFFSGFEENAGTTSAQWIKAGFSAIAGGPTFDSTVKHSGSYSLLADANGDAVRLDFGAGYISGSKGWIRFYYRPTAAPTGATVVILRVNSTGGAQAWTLDHLATNQLRINGTTTLTTALLNTWNRIEIEFLTHLTAGTVRVQLFDADSLTARDDQTFSGATMAGSTSTGQFLFGWTSGAATGYTANYDDIALNNEIDDGSGETTWCSPGKTALLTPTGSPSTPWGTAVPAVAHHLNVDETPGEPDDDTSYVATNTLNLEERFSLSDLPAEVPLTGVTMRNLLVFFRTRGEAALSATTQALVWDNTNTQIVLASRATSISTTTWGTRFSGINLSGSVTLALKTRSNVNGYDIGFEILTGTATARLSAMWANVEWIESTAPPGQPATRRIAEDTPGLARGSVRRM